MVFKVPFISRRKYVNALRNEHARRIGVVFEVLERIPRFIDEVTRIRGVDLHVGARTSGENITTGLPNGPINFHT